MKANLQTLPDEVLMDEVRRRGLVGRPVIIRLCRWCKRPFGGREIREHEPACEKNPRNKRI